MAAVNSNLISTTCGKVIESFTTLVFDLFCSIDWLLQFTQPKANRFGSEYWASNWMLFPRNIKETFEIVITTHCVSLRNSHAVLRCVRLINSVKLALYSLMSSAFNSIHRITMSPRGLSFISLPRTHRLTDQPMSNCNQNGQTTTTSSGNIFQHSLPYSNWFPSSWTKEECDLHSDW